jgi:hypothetical protein
MSSGVPINSARRTKTYAAAAIQDDDGIKTSIASSTSIAVYTVADWNGAAVGAAGLLDLPRSITISRSSSANAYSVNPIVVTGLRGGSVVTENIAQPNDDGNDVLRGTQLFDFITGVTIPANAAGTGAFKIGVQDIGCPLGGTFSAVRLETAGPLNVAYDEKGSTVDTLNVSTTIEPIAAKRIRTSTALSAPTVAALTVYLP